MLLNTRAQTREFPCCKSRSAASAARLATLSQSPARSEPDEAATPSLLMSPHGNGRQNRTLRTRSQSYAMAASGRLLPGGMRARPTKTSLKSGQETVVHRQAEIVAPQGQDRDPERRRKLRMYSQRHPGGCRRAQICIGFKSFVIGRRRSERLLTEVDSIPGWQLLPGRLQWSR